MLRKAKLVQELKLETLSYDAKSHIRLESLNKPTACGFVDSLDNMLVSYPSSMIWIMWLMILPVDWNSGSASHFQMWTIGITDTDWVDYWVDVNLEIMWAIIPVHSCAIIMCIPSRTGNGVLIWSRLNLASSRLVSSRRRVASKEFVAPIPWSVVFSLGVESDFKDIWRLIFVRLICSMDWRMVFFTTFTAASWRSTPDVC